VTVREVDLAAQRTFVASYLDSHPDEARLAEGVCLAVHIEPALIRRARLVFVPGSTAGLEARLWFSPLCRSSGYAGISLLPAAADLLRGRLRTDGERLRQVRRLTASVHHDAGTAVQVFERLLWLDLTGGAHDADLDSGLRTLSEAMVAEGQAGNDLCRWILTTLPLLPSELRAQPDVAELEVLAAEALGRPTAASLTGPAGSDAFAAARAALHRPIEVGLTLRTDGLILSIPPVRDSQVLTAAGRGSAVIAIEPVAPLVVGEPVRIVARPGSVSVRMTVTQIIGSGGEVRRTAVNPLGAAPLASSRTGHRTAWLTAGGMLSIRSGSGDELAEMMLPADGRMVALSADGATVLAVVDEIAHLLAVSDQPGTEPPGVSLPIRTKVSACAVSDDGTAAGFAADRRVLLIHRDRAEPAWLPIPATVVAPAAMWFAPGSTDVIWVAGDTGLYLTARDPVAAPEVAGWPVGALTAIAHSPDRQYIVWALDDGSIWRWFAGFTRRIGSAPWRVTSIAVGPGAAPVVHAVGNSMRVLRWSFDGHEIAPLELGIFATWLAAIGDELMVVGGGSPVRIRCMNGATYVINPTAAPDSPTDQPEWLYRTLVLRLTDELLTTDHTAGDYAALADRLGAAPGATVVIGPVRPGGAGRLPGESEMPPGPVHIGHAMLLIQALHTRGLRVAVAMDPTDGDPSEILAAVRRWVRADIDMVLMDQPGTRADVVQEAADLATRFSERAIGIRGPAPTPAAPLTPHRHGWIADRFHAGDYVHPERVIDFQIHDGLSEVDRLAMMAFALSLPCLPEFEAGAVSTLSRAGRERVHRMVATRAAEPALLTGTLTPVTTFLDPVLAHLRTEGASMVLCAVNLDDSGHTIAVSDLCPPDRTPVPLLDPVNAEFWLEPYEAQWWALRTATHRGQ
jgi:hypothetical protein